MSDKSFRVNQTCEINKLLFDLGKYDVNEQIEVGLKPTLEFLKQNPNLIIEIGVHRDSRGRNTSSKCLSCRRARSISDYLIKEGINESRLIAKGYGETKPVTIFEIDSISKDTLTIALTEKYINQFKNTDKKRYEELHALNRRIELKIISTDFVGNEDVTEVELIKEMKGDFTAFSIDNFDNIYTTNKDVIVKYNSNFDTLFFSSLKSFIPSSIESSKSFRNLIFDNEKGSVKFLDNTLTEVYTEFDLIDQDILQAVLVCESFNGNAFWVLDMAGLQLVKLNQNLEVITVIDNLGYLFEDKESPVQMFEKNDQLYIHFPTNGIAVFDSFGTFLKYMPVNFKWVDVQNNFLFGLNNDLIEILEFPFLDKAMELDFGKATINRFSVKKKKTYIQTSNGIYIYSVEKITDNK